MAAGNAFWVGRTGKTIEESRSLSAIYLQQQRQVRGEAAEQRLSVEAELRSLKTAGGNSCLLPNSSDSDVA